jgi:hypothetical protein
MVQFVIEYNPATGQFGVRTNASDRVLQLGMLAFAQAQIAQGMAVEELRGPGRPSLVIPDGPLPQVNK